MDTNETAEALLAELTAIGASFIPYEAVAKQILAKALCAADTKARQECAHIADELAQNAAFESWPYTLVRDAILKSMR